MSRRKKITKRASTFSRGRAYKNFKYKKSVIADWEGNIYAKIEFNEWFERSYKKISKLRNDKNYNFVWKNFSNDKNKLREQLYYDRVYISKSYGIDMKDSIRKLENTRAFITNNDLYWRNMVNSIRNREPRTFATLTNILGVDPYDPREKVVYDQDSGGFILQGQGVRYLIWCKYDSLSPKTSKSGESDFVIEAIEG